MKCEHKYHSYFFNDDGEPAWPICFECMRGGSIYSWVFSIDDNGDWSGRNYYCNASGTEIFLTDSIKQQLTQLYEEWCIDMLDAIILKTDTEIY